MIVVPLFFIAYATTTTHTHTHSTTSRVEGGSRVDTPRLPPLAHVAGPWRESCEGGLEGPKGQASCRSTSALEGRTVKNYKWFHHVGYGCRPKYIAQGGGGGGGEEKLEASVEWGAGPREARR